MQGGIQGVMLAFPAGLTLRGGFRRITLRIVCEKWNRAAWCQHLPALAGGSMGVAV
jgi:hypothetical protein